MDPVIDMALRAALALLFLLAAGHKVGDLGRFRAALAGYRLLPAALVLPAVVVVVGAELAVTAALVVPGLRRPALVGAAAVLLVYGAAIAINLARGRRDIDCGCAGPAGGQPLSGWLVARNAVLATAALTALAPLRPRELVWMDGLTVAGATLVLAGLYAACDRLIAAAPAFASARGDA